MNIFGKLEIRSPDSDSLLIHREAGLFFWLFMLIYFGFTICINSLFAILLWESQLPRRLTCEQERQIVTCDYVIRGLINGRTLRIQNVKTAIPSRVTNGATIVLTGSAPWIDLGSTTNNIQNIQFINQGIDRLKASEKTWKFDVYASTSEREFIIFFFIPIGLLFFTVGLITIFNNGHTTLRLNSKADIVSITRLGWFRRQLSSFSQLSAADAQVPGYLGILSERFGIYGGDLHNRRRNYRIVRLLFTNRRPFVFHQQRLTRDRSYELVAAINSFIDKHK